MKALFLAMTGLMLSLALPVFAMMADLSIGEDAISFSEDLIAGSEVRIYAQVTNVGDIDVSGYVMFFQGSVPIGESQVISVRTSGVPEEVYVDFVVPSGSFNIRAEIRGTDPEDANDENNLIVTKLLTPTLDDDRDGVENDTDNCLSDENINQIDSDQDGSGNACDGDDDDDGLSDDVEEELGTKTTSKDTDGDGVEDSKDAYPLDETKSIVAPKAVIFSGPVEEQAAPSTPVGRSGSNEEVDDSDNGTDESLDIPGDAEQADDSVAEETIPSIETEIHYSTNAVFSYQRTSWNTYSFQAIAVENSGNSYRWDFGDGVTSSRSSVSHTYSKPGSYPVSYTITDASDQATTDVANLTVPFWSLENRVVQILSGLLGLLLLFGIALIVRLSRRPRPDLVINQPVVEQSEVVQEDEKFDEM